MLAIKARPQLSGGLLWRLLLIALTATVVHAKAPTDRLFTGNTELEMELTAPWKTIKKNSHTENKYPAVLSIVVPGAADLEFDVQVSARGKTRRMKKICLFPPLKLWFEKSQVKGTLLHGVKSLKLVTHCNPSKKYSDYYAREYLAYRIYNVITDLSFRVRPVEMTYSETDSVGSEIQFAFFIEDVDDMADRNGMREAPRKVVPANDLDALPTAMLAIFQYMIGNHDWNAQKGPREEDCCHNVKLISPESSEKVVPVPYDFDFSGLVDAHYSSLPKGMRVSRITKRKYMGFCHAVPHTAAVIEMFKNKRSAFEALIADQSRLDKRSKTLAKDYLDFFYRAVKSPNDVHKRINAECHV